MRKGRGGESGDENNLTIQEKTHHEVRSSSSFRENTGSALLLPLARTSHHVPFLTTPYQIESAMINRHMAVILAVFCVLR